ncbi:PREDICTED: DEAD-box ATP-dependent RNA helicase 47, mitochondrial [Theobroma cacao]|uniref:RNA helicase n=2 Tax=Theobroma cacao TaxID=3641 RepID=A0A061G4A4_THECC|nr:PREDICTED: DEAD-box ATP-dependent RNA helicase 47, mitochondrial [Theobroma cacao]EOY24655.1 P-loop containing nucleoside triphosphate hydrolases superfamily protein [Theobroma cacao]
MPALASTRLLLFFGESLPFHRFPSVSRKVWCQLSVRFVSQVNHNNGPLTLASLGFKSEFGETNKNKGNKIERLSVSNEAPKSKVRVIGSNSIKGVKVVGVKKSLEIESAPFAAQSFPELGLPPLLLESLETAGYTVPTDVQSVAVPTVLKGHDVVIQSYTGSGKTLAYLLPILSEVGPLKKKSPNGNGESGKKREIEAVIVAPSRELGMQIVREFEKLLGPADKRVVQQLVGGANRSRQEEALKKNKPAIVVGTPGRIAEISAAGKLHTHGCRFLVLDEVDELLSFNFREDMHRILEHVGRRSGADPRGSLAKWAERQTIMVSATVPYSVIRAARSWGRDPLLVQAKKVMPLESVSPSGPVNLLRPTSSSDSSSNMQTQAASQSLPPALKHYHCVTKLQHKVDTLRRCVHALDSKSVIAFMNHAKQLKDAVFKLEARGMKAAELHGDLGKLVRSTTLKKFKHGEVRVLVTNELSARGLDVAECDLVVNLDLPTDSIHYAHRAGRTGRLGRKGTVVTICEEPEVFVVKKLQKQLGVPIPACEFTEGKLHVIEEEKPLGAAR